MFFDDGNYYEGEEEKEKEKILKWSKFMILEYCKKKKNTNPLPAEFLFSLFFYSLSLFS